MCGTSHDTDVYRRDVHPCVVRKTQNMKSRIVENRGYEKEEKKKLKNTLCFDRPYRREVKRRMERNLT